MSSSKIYLHQGKMNPKLYTVYKLVNRVVPEVGFVLNREDVQKLMTDIPNLSVEITELKR